VHFSALICAVFSIFEWHDLKFELSRKSGSDLVRHGFYLFEIIMLLPMGLWIVEALTG
jgi:hypothetical protein